jgi:hypothetical protein
VSIFYTQTERRHPSKMKKNREKRSSLSEKRLGGAKRSSL